MAAVSVKRSIDNRPIFYSEWHRKGIIKVRHLRQDDSNNFLTLLE